MAEALAAWLRVGVREYDEATISAPTTTSATTTETITTAPTKTAPPLVVVCDPLTEEPIYCQGLGARVYHARKKKGGGFFIEDLHRKCVQSKNCATAVQATEALRLLASGEHPSQLIVPSRQSSRKRAAPTIAQPQGKVARLQGGQPNNKNNPAGSKGMAPSRKRTRAVINDAKQALTEGNDSSAQLAKHLKRVTEHLDLECSWNIQVEDDLFKLKLRKTQTSDRVERSPSFCALTN